MSLPSTASIRLRALPYVRYGQVGETINPAYRQEDMLDSDPDDHEDPSDRAPNNAEAAVRTHLVVRGRSVLDPDSITLSEELPKWRRCWSHGWWLEILAAVAVIAAEVATCFTIWRFEGEPLLKYARVISIGTMLATYSMVLRLGATYLLSEGLARLKWRWYYEKVDTTKGLRPLYDFVLHDDATRGPWGALVFLFKLPYPFRWQWIGCSLVLLTLLVGPFEQQMLAYRGCSVELKTAGNENTVARTSLFLGKRTRRSKRTGLTLSMAEQSSINAGMLGSGLPAYGCETGDCTYDTYTSLGYCSRCTDMSEQVYVQHVNQSTLLSGSTRNSWQRDSTICLPSGLCNHYKYHKLHGNDSEASAGHFVTSGLSLPVGMGFDFAEQQSFEILLGFAGGPFNPATGRRPAGCADNATETWECRGYAAASCALFPCVRGYSSAVTNGTFQENITSVEIDALNTFQSKKSHPIYAAIYTPTLSHDDIEHLRLLNYTTNPAGSDWIPYNLSHTSDPSDLTSDYSDFEKRLLANGSLYAIDGDFHKAVTAYVGAAFSGTLSGSRDIHDRITITHGFGLLGSIYNYGKFSLNRTESIFNNISMSLTNHIRQDPGVELTNNAANGKAYEMKTCIYIRWIWWSAPAALAVLSILFFLGVVVTSRGMSKEVRSWKSSPLPLIFNGPPDIGLKGDPFPDLQHIQALNAVAKHTGVKLARDEGGLMELRSKRDLTVSVLEV